MLLEISWIRHKDEDVNVLPRICDPTIAIFGFPIKPLSTELPLLRNQARLHFTPVRSNLGRGSALKMITSEPSEFVSSGQEREREMLHGFHQLGSHGSSVAIDTSLHPAAKNLLSHLIHLKGRTWSAWRSPFIWGYP